MQMFSFKITSQSNILELHFVGNSQNEQILWVTRAENMALLHFVTCVVTLLVIAFPFKIDVLGH